MCPREAETQKKPQQCENRGFDDADSLVRQLWMLLGTAATDAVADFEAGH
jgi:hypothetical protein